MESNNITNVKFISPENKGYKKFVEEISLSRSFDRENLADPCTILSLELEEAMREFLKKECLVSLSENRILSYERQQINGLRPHFLELDGIHLDEKNNSLCLFEIKSSSRNHCLLEAETQLLIRDSIICKGDNFNISGLYIIWIKTNEETLSDKSMDYFYKKYNLIDINTFRREGLHTGKRDKINLLIINAEYIWYYALRSGLIKTENKGLLKEAKEEIKEKKINNQLRQKLKKNDLRTENPNVRSYKDSLSNRGVSFIKKISDLKKNTRMAEAFKMAALKKLALT